MSGLSQFEEIYSQHWEKLYAFCYKLTRDKYLSENIVQEVFMNLWERRTTLQVISIESFLFRAVKNQVLKEYRKKKIDAELIEGQFEDYLMENLSSLDIDLIEKMYRMLEELPPKRKQILVLNKLEELDIQQISDQLNLSKQTVKNQLSSALQQLRLKASNLLDGMVPMLFVWLSLYL